MRKYRKPYRIKRKKSIFRSRFFWLAILILIISGGIFYLICFALPFQIKEIKISGNQKVLTEDLQNIIQNQIEQKVLFLPSKSIFLVNLKEINNALLEEFPQIGKVDLKRKFLDKLIVIVKERESVAVFIQNENLFFIDREGIIFEKVKENELELLKVKNLTLNRELKLGEKAIEEEKLSQILEINSKLNENLKISLTEILIISEERLNAKTSEGWEIYLNPKGDIDWQLTKLNLVLKERIPPEKRRNVEYIDLRFEKVYIFPETYWQ